ncbi:MAG: CPBP family intramembrane metalloprotease [Proteobacteria bacterium]|nr:CPBP family intramembrane metalloprotease [Pseudomonadota bacterium]
MCPGSTRSASIPWSFGVALAVTAALFGSAHLPGALLHGQGLTIGSVAVTGAGGAWFGWLLMRWGWSVWVPVAAHISINAWWVLFSTGATAASGGSEGLWSRVAAITFVTVLTIRWTDEPAAG